MKLLDLPKLDPAALRARVAGRAYWAARYRDGRIAAEWEIDWALLPKRGLASLRLYCPNGQIAEVGSTVDAGGRLFQLKVGLATAGGERRQVAQLIGLVDGPDGQARCYAWEPGPGRLVGFRDNVYQMRYEQLGPLAFDVLGLRLD